jgi:hypothetical protein
VRKGFDTLRGRRRQSGVLLLTVALLLAVMAALAFSMNRAAGMDIMAVSADYERRNAAYLAEGAAAAGKWTNEVQCGSQDLKSLQLAGATLSAIVDVNKKMLDISATATTATGATATLMRTGVRTFDLANPENKDLGGARDTYIYSTQWGPMNGASTLELSGQSNALLFWDTKDIPPDSTVLAAKLKLTLSSASSSTSRIVDLYEVTTDWDDNAMWYRARGAATPWATPGGDYYPNPVASAKLPASGSASWDLTALASDWYDNKASNQGVLLRIRNTSQSASFNSRDTASGQRPALNVTFSKLCKL